MKVVVSAFAMLAAMVGCATAGDGPVVVYSSTAPGYATSFAGDPSIGERALLNRLDRLQAERFAASRYGREVAFSSANAGYLGGTYAYATSAASSSLGERALLDRLNRLQAERFAASRYSGEFAYSLAAPGVLGQSDYLAGRRAFPAPLDAQGCHRYIIDPDDPCFWYSP